MPLKDNKASMWRRSERRDDASTKDLHGRSAGLELNIGASPLSTVDIVLLNDSEFVNREVVKAFACV
jgi:hypothetical protein